MKVEPTLQIHTKVLDPTKWGGELFDHGVAMKLARAQDHLSTLRSEMDTILTDEARCGFERRCSTDARTISYIFGFSEQNPYPRWGVITGDVIHNLRAALDHSVFALAVHNQLKPRPQNEHLLAFPIANSAGEWKDSARRIQGISEAAVIALRNAQPYVTGSKNLARLARLSNEDKHRNVTIAAVAPKEFDIPLKELVGRLLSLTVPARPVADFDTPLLDFALEKPNPNWRPRFRSTVNIVVLDGDEWFDVQDWLAECAGEVAQVVRTLRQLVV